MSARQKPATWKPAGQAPRRETISRPMCAEGCSPCLIECAVLGVITRQHDQRLVELSAQEPVETSPDWPAWHAEVERVAGLAESRRAEWDAVWEAWDAGGRRLHDGWPVAMPSTAAH